MHNPGLPHIKALKHLLRYLSTTRAFGLVYNCRVSGSKTGVYGYYDASHADCPDTRKSTLAYVYYLGNCLISWHTKLHSFITTSTNHSEYCAAAKAAREAKFLHSLFNAIGFPALVGPIDLFSDSKGSIAMAYNPVHRAVSKHVDLADHYSRELQERGIITISYVNTKDMRADLLTKALARPQFDYLVPFLVRPIQSVKST